MEEENTMVEQTDQETNEKAVSKTREIPVTLLVIAFVVLGLILISITVLGDNFRAAVLGNVGSQSESQQFVFSFDEGGVIIENTAWLEMQAEAREKAKDVHVGVLKVVDDEGVGVYFSEAKNELPLYFKIDGVECDETCMEGMTPYQTIYEYVSPEHLEQDYIGTVKVEGTNWHHYTWEGKPLYTYYQDAPMSIQGDGHNGAFSLARP